MKFISKEEIENKHKPYNDYYSSLYEVLEMMEDGKSEDEMTYLKNKVKEYGIKINITEVDYQKEYERYLEYKKEI